MDDKSKAKERYEEILSAKYGQSNVVPSLSTGDFDWQKPMEHKCVTCSKLYLSSPHQMLTYRAGLNCIPCSVANKGRRKGLAEIAVVKSLASKFVGLSMVGFRSKSSPCRFECECGYHWSAKPVDVLSSKYGCPSCSDGKDALTKQWSADEIRDKLRAITAQIGIEDIRFDPRKGIVRAICNMCGMKWTTSLPSLLSGSESCLKCASLGLVPKSKSNLCGATGVAAPEKSASVFLEGREVTVTIIEARAIKFLLGKGLTEDKIWVASSGVIDNIVYVIRGAVRGYVPQLKANNTMVDVKTLGELCDSLEQFKARAKACLKAGFGHRMLLEVGSEVYALGPEWLKWKPEDARVFVRRKTVKSVRVLSMDPGVTNFAWSVLEVTRPCKVRLIATGMMEHTLKTLTGEVLEDVHKFIGEVRALKEEYEVTHMILERFMSRGMKGLTIELVNQMLGVAMGMWGLDSGSGSGAADKRNDPSLRTFKLVTAAQWKNEWNRRSDLKAYYTKVQCEVHQVDAIGIGIYGAAFWLDEEPFKDIRKLERLLVAQIQKTNVELRRC